MSVSAEPLEKTSEYSSLLRDYVDVARRRSVLITATATVCVFAAAGFSAQQSKLHEGTAEVLLSRVDIAASLTGSPDTLIAQDASRVADTQVQLAAVPQVAEGALKRVPAARKTPLEFLRQANVVTKPNTDILAFSVRDSRPSVASDLATAYAESFVAFRRDLDTASVSRARQGVIERLAILRRTSRDSGPLYDNLVDKSEQLSTLEALKTSNATLVRPASGTVQVQPRVMRNLLAGLIFGVFAALALAFTREALDTRMRSAEDIGRHLGLPLLAKIPAPPRELRTRNQLLMIEHPHHPQSEVFRLLRTSLQFSLLDHEINSMMVTSARVSEGKSVTIANLAVAMARAGEHVVLVDLDLRRPMMDRFFLLEGRPGLTSVVLGRVDIDEALVSVPLADDSGNESPGEIQPSAFGKLEVLASGPRPPDPGEFVSTQALADTLALLKNRCDFLLVDAPPALTVGDALSLSNQVDGMIVVARANVVRRPMLTDLARFLTSTRCASLGFVMTDAELEDGYGYGYGYRYEYVQRRAARNSSLMAVSLQRTRPVPDRPPAGVRSLWRRALQVLGRNPQRPRAPRLQADPTAP